VLYQLTSDDAVQVECLDPVVRIPLCSAKKKGNARQDTANITGVTDFWRKSQLAIASVYTRIALHFYINFKDSSTSSSGMSGNMSARSVHSDFEPEAK